MNHPVESVELIVPHIPFKNGRLGQKSCINKFLFHFINFIVSLSRLRLSNGSFSSLVNWLFRNDVILASNKVRVNVSLLEQVSNPLPLDIILVWLELLLCQHLSVLLHLLQELFSLSLNLVQMVLLNRDFMLGCPLEHLDLVLGSLGQKLHFWEFFERLVLLLFLHGYVPLVCLSSLPH